MVQKPYSCEHVVEIEDEPRHHLVVENEFVRAFAVEVGPHDRTLCHRHNHDYLMYVASIADIISAPQDKTPETHLYYDGECELSPAGMVHVVENLTDALPSGLRGTFQTTPLHARGVFFFTHAVPRR